MWRILECPRLNLPLAVLVKRFDAPLCVFNFGMGFLVDLVGLDNLLSLYEMGGKVEYFYLRSNSITPGGSIAGARSSEHFR
jgi:hypothetical protein